MKKLFLVLLMLFLPCTGFGATYYVDNSAGADANAGTSEGAAWATIVKVNASSFSAGDTIKFKKGQTWRETLTPPSSGSAGSPITFNSYGTGANPITTIDNNQFRANPGFDTLTSGTPDDATTDDFANWAESPVASGYVEATVTHKLSGTDGCIISNGGTANGYVRLSIIAKPSTTYYFNIWVKRISGAGQNLCVRLADTTSGTYDLQSDKTTWTLSTTTYLTDINTTSATYERKGFAFTTMPTGTRTLRIDIMNRDATGAYAIDCVSVREGAGASYLELQGVENNGNLTYLMNVNGKNYVTIDGIDTIGAINTTDASALTFNVSIRGTSDNIILKNGSHSYAYGVGIDDVGTTTTNITFDNLTVHHCNSTGIYMRCIGGTISNCNVYSNGGGSSGDRGGIGANTGGNWTIDGNTVHDNGLATADTDGAISVVLSTLPVKIRKNYIYNSNTMAIQICEATNSSGSEIGYNLINVFGTTSSAAATNPGKLSGIRVGHSAGGAPGVKVYNNVIMGGARAIDDTYENAGLFFGGATTVYGEVYNNIFANNTCRDITIDHDVTASTDFKISNNCYYKSGAYTGNFDFKGSNVNSLALWQAALAGNVKVPDIGSIATDPKFVSASDFSLQADSPCIDAGIFPGGSLNTDYAGNTRLRGPAFDIGAYEYQAGGTIYGGSMTGTFQ